MTTTNEALNLSNEEVVKVIQDFMDHLSVAEIVFYDVKDKHKFSQSFILDNYMATFD